MLRTAHYFKLTVFALGVFISCLSATLGITSEDIADQYPQSPLYQKPIEFFPQVFSAIGATAPPTYENAGHNNNLSFIITGEGVVVINAGASYLLAQALHDEIKQRTHQPVILVINENGQGHAMLGNSYWVDQGIQVLAHEDADAEFAEFGFSILENMRGYNRENAEGTRLQRPTQTFSDTYTLTLGTFEIKVLYLGPAHSPGDIVVWLPKQNLVIAGDMAFHERMLPIFPHTNAADWIETWDTAFEPLGATHIIPGHGHPTVMAQVRRYTRDYLVFLRRKIGDLIEEGGDLEQAYYIDQSPYAHLDTFEELARRNAGFVYEQMEFE